MTSQHALWPSLLGGVHACRFMFGVALTSIGLECILQPWKVSGRAWRRSPNRHGCSVTTSPKDLVYTTSRRAYCRPTYTFVHYTDVGSIYMHPPEDITQPRAQAHGLALTSSLPSLESYMLFYLH